MVAQPIAVGERLEGHNVSLRLVTLDDCTQRYCDWLNDPLVNQYLETRWARQSIEQIESYVSAMLASPAHQLFAIIENDTDQHVGNLHIGPINAVHQHADLSYFIGERRVWGRGYASEAIGLAVTNAFCRLGLHRLEAGVYDGNDASARALLKNGFVYEGRAVKRYRLNTDGPWVDRLLYGLVNKES
ncbi:MAG: GNAT family protein [Deltaproteobacteria bacterium]|nr:GNAT family protein [Deltaproteobacteria bacterium]